MKRRLVTSALPYVNNVPHLGNLLQVLSADVFARFCRLKGYETLYVCGTDEYGTATETKALEEGVTPKALCDRFHAIHAEIYSWFGIDFDRFGRTSTEKQTAIVQELFTALDAAGYVTEQVIEQLYCDSCKRFLADRYVKGECPKCGYVDARGDQCESCGSLLDPVELKKPRCSTCGSEPAPKTTRHLYIDLPAIKPRLEAWIKRASVDGFWSNNAIQMTQAWIRDGLKPRAITRDLKWGIPVPKDGFREKVFYVWFDAPIGYISITACHTDDWRSWWQSPEDVELFQFIGKDNIPFHTVIFPSTLLGSGGTWTMLHHMSSTEYLNYEGGKFSKSRGMGVFGTDAKDSGIPADVWRFYLFYNRPEKADVNFTWKDFQEKVNGELIGNLGNLANRTLTFVSRYYGGIIPEGTIDQGFADATRQLEADIADKLDRAELRDAFRLAFELSSMANKRFQDGEPWKTRTTDPQAAASLIRELCFVLRDLAIILHPYIPTSADKLAAFFGLKVGRDGLDWSHVGSFDGLRSVGNPEVLFAKLEDDFVDALKHKHAGTQVEPAAPVAEKTQQIDKDLKEKILEKTVPPLHDLPIEERFSRLLDLRVAQIVKIERHPKADKLYVETVDDGSGNERVIVSGLVPFYKEEELLGKKVILAANLKSAKLRGIESRGMLLAAGDKVDPENERVEVLEAPNEAPGTRVALEGMEPCAVPAELDIDSFFSVPIRATGGAVLCGEKRLVAGATPLSTSKVSDGSVG
jgi:methionyl-tRNA synthetase